MITNFIHYSRNLLVLKELLTHPSVELHVVVAGTALLSKYSARHAYIKEMLMRDDFKNIHEVYFNLEGGKPVVKAKTAGLGIIELSAIYNQISPDLIVIRGDRFEGLSIATTALLMNIPTAHIEGGDISGTADEIIRHAITKLSHIHFTTNEDSRRRILRMGEQPKYVFNFGSPDIEVLDQLGNTDASEGVSATGSGADVNVHEDFIIIMYHPVTTELDQLPKHTRVLLSAIHELGIQAFWFWPNFDAGAEEAISRELRVFNDNVKDHKIRFLRYLPPEQYISLLKAAKCVVGNSSSAIKECSYLGIPAVNIGSRQLGRLRSKNVIDVSEDKKAIKETIRRQISVGRYKPSYIYKSENTSKNIADTLATIDLYVQKKFSE